MALELPYFSCVLEVKLLDSLFAGRSSCGDLADEPAKISPTASVTSMPSCLPFPWFGDRGPEKDEEAEKDKERLRSVSSSSLPYLTTTGRRDQVRKKFDV